MLGLMFHQAKVYRPTIASGATAQEIDSYSVLLKCCGCFIQPADSRESWYYNQRGDENTHTIYTTSMEAFQRNDLFLWNDRQFHIVGVKNGLNMNIYQECAAYEYPEGAKKRLDKEAFE